MYPDRSFDPEDEEMPEFGKVQRYSPELGEFHDVSNKKGDSLWLENL
jgi:hypothetical protein